MRMEYTCHCLDRPPNENLSRSESVTRITNYDSYTMCSHIICLDIVNLTSNQSLFKSVMGLKRGNLSSVDALEGHPELYTRQYVQIELDGKG